MEIELRTKTYFMGALGDCREFKEKEQLLQELQQQLADPFSEGSEDFPSSLIEEGRERLNASTSTDPNQKRDTNDFF